ncbi:MAG: esterase [Nocardia sp.]|uniref:alpha/beta hydrolase n=1 Tax=Nocardia sp. TaxID=1821 RepID=UPI002636943A|nr:alpha/beta hydrolase [Nocardia sp.]MCU1648816.1 esterase [Nocardia sp.]
MKLIAKTTNRQLRIRGALYRSLHSNASEDDLRRQSLRSARAMSLLRHWKPKGIRISQEWAVRPDGSLLRLLVCSPLEPQRQAPGVLWLHGGGYIFGCPEMEISLYRQLIEQSDCIVVAPDYRKSSEAPYPAALEDSYLALLWLRDNASRLSVRDDQIAVGGSSAGGGLAAALALYARDRGDVAIAFQMPLYPMIDDRSATESARENDAPVWDAVTNMSAWKLYLKDLYGTDDVPAYAAAARATDYEGLPPTLTYVGDLEPFRDETTHYVESLRAAGVPVEFKVFPGCWHAFDFFAPKAEVSLEAAQFRNRWFRHAVQTYFAEQPTSA